MKDSLASAKIELDLQLEKVERERASFTDGHKAELEMKNMALSKLKEELADKETLLDLTREELVSFFHTSGRLFIKVAQLLGHTAQYFDCFF